MKYRMRIVKVAPCGCDGEGEVRAILENGREIWFYYQGTDGNAYAQFSTLAPIEVEIVGRLCAATIVADSKKALLFPMQNSAFTATGSISNIRETADGKMVLLESEISLVFDNELGEDPVAVGDFISVSGELWADNWWD
jgi:hypothetical protein